MKKVKLEVKLRKKIFFQTLFMSGLLLMFLQSLNAWFTWNLHPLLIPIMGSLFSILFSLESPSSFLLNTKNLTLCILLLASSLICAGDGSYIRTTAAVIPIMYVITLRANLKIELLNFLTKALAWLLFASLVVWVLLLAGISLPSFGKISHPAWDMYVYDNYLVTLRNGFLYSIRFCSIFLEPGQLGMICSFLLYANKFDFRNNRYLIIILVAVLFTLSLAAYVLVLVAFSIYMALYSKKRWIYFSTWGFVLIGGYFFFTTLNDGKNIVNELIISRLQYDSNEGDIAGNNRFSQRMDDYFEDFMRTDDAWLGIGSQKYVEMDFGANAGYKVFILQNGLFGLLSALLFYLFLVFYNSSRFSWMFLFVYIIAFLQRAYPFWASELLIFITAMPLSYYIKKDGKLI